MARPGPQRGSRCCIMRARTKGLMAGRRSECFSSTGTLGATVTACSVLCFRCLRAARIGKMKRRKQDEGQVCPLCSRPLAGSEQELSRHVERCLSKVEGPPRPAHPTPRTRAAACFQICGLSGSLCGLSSFFSVLLPPPCFHSPTPPLGSSGELLGKPEVLGLWIG